MAEDFSQRLTIDLGSGAEGGFFKTQKKPTADIVTLTQVHGADGFRVGVEFFSSETKGDWLWTTQPQQAVGVFVADCTAILVNGENFEGRFVAAIHAGWRGTASDVLNRSILSLRPKAGWRAWLSPSICQNHFEVGGEVIEALGKDAVSFAKPGMPGKYYLDLKGLQAKRLHDLGGSLQISSLCTYCDSEFTSYRRDKSDVERQLAWVRLTD